MQSPAGALVIIIPMLICIIAFMALAYRRDRISMWLFAPYALWVAFATVLNASIGILN
jgi:tryptophan-rich sensory protein